MKRDFKEKRPDEWQERRIPNEAGDGYKKTPTESEAFEEYYQHQSVVPDGEWDAFMSCLRTPLPATFRINGSGKFAAQLRDKLETDFFSRLQQAPAEVLLCIVISICIDVLTVITRLACKYCADHSISNYLQIVKLMTEKLEMT